MMERRPNGYELSRRWFDFCFENPDKIKPHHTAIYFFAVEHCNRLGWKRMFGFPTTMAMEALGISSYNTYINAFNDLVKFGFIELIEKSKNQYSSNIIALSNFDEALDEALDKALSKHGTKQRESTIQSTIQSTVQSTVSINKQLNNITIKQGTIYSDEFEKVWNLYTRRGSKKKAFVEWKKMTDFERDTALAHIPIYIATFYDDEDKQYIAHFDRYLRDELYYQDVVPRVKKYRMTEDDRKREDMQRLGFVI
jgi:hypothetical protein